MKAENKNLLNLIVKTISKECFDGFPTKSNNSDIYVSAEKIINSISAEDVKTWFQLLVGFDEGQMRYHMITGVSPSPIGPTADTPAQGENTSEI